MTNSRTNLKPRQVFCVKFYHFGVHQSFYASHFFERFWSHVKSKILLIEEPVFNWKQYFVATKLAMRLQCIWKKHSCYHRSKNTYRIHVSAKILHVFLFLIIRSMHLMQIAKKKFSVKSQSAMCYYHSRIRHFFK